MSKPTEILVILHVTILAVVSLILVLKYENTANMKGLFLLLLLVNTIA